MLLRITEGRQDRQQGDHISLENCEGYTASRRDAEGYRDRQLGDLITLLRYFIIR
jgi:hypothetical protein